MNSYLLLRDKIESKALSLEELQTMGLRSTDLIWVECQSWDWQRPQEIPELRILLSGKASVINPTATNPSAVKLEPVNPVSAITNHQSSLPGNQVGLRLKKTILPEPESETDIFKYGGINPVIGAPNADKYRLEKEIGVGIIEDNVTPSAIDNTPVLLPGNTVFGDKDIVKPGDDHATGQFKEITPALQTNYSRSLDEIKDLYVKNLAKQGKLGNKKSAKWSPALLKKAAVYVGFAIAGAMIVLLAQDKNTNKLNGNLPAAEATVQTIPHTVINEPGESISGFEPVSTIDVSPAREPGSNSPEERRYEEKPGRIAVEKKPIESEVEEEGKEIVKEAAVQSEGSAAKKSIVTEDISSQLSLRANQYVTGSFGGIRDLQMTLQNDSKYLLDAVKVEIKYLNLDHITVHIEQVIFRSVDPGKAETIAVKKTRRGVRIKYRITKIESSDAGSTAGF